VGANHAGCGDGSDGDGTGVFIVSNGNVPGGGGRGVGGRGGGAQGKNGSALTGSGTGSAQAGGSGSGPGINPRKCVHWSGEHPYLYYCEEFIKAQVNDRFQMVFKQKSCVCCLGMGSKQNSPKATWWAVHEPHCRTKFACNKDGFSKLAVSNQ
jgi:hypothetical protein